MLSIQKELFLKQIDAYNEIGKLIHQRCNDMRQPGFEQTYHPTNGNSQIADDRNTKRKNTSQGRLRVMSQHYEVPQRYLPMPRESALPKSKSAKQDFISVTHKHTQVVEKSYTSLQPTNNQLYKGDQIISSPTLEFLFSDNVQNDAIRQQTKLPEIKQNNTQFEIKLEPPEHNENIIPQLPEYYPEPDTNVQEILVVGQDTTAEFDTDVSPYDSLVIDSEGQ